MQARKKQARGELRSRQILEAARELFAERGYEGASMAELAERVGVVEGTLYKHYSSKRELMVEVLRRFYEDIIQDVDTHLQGIQGTSARLRYVIWRQLRAFTESPDLCRMVICWVRPFDDYAQSAVRQFNRTLTGYGLRVIMEGQESGEFAKDMDPAMVRDLIYGAIEHIAWRVVNGQGELHAGEVADRLTKMVLGGIARPDGSATKASAEVSLLAAQIARLEKLIDSREPQT